MRRWRKSREEDLDRELTLHLELEEEEQRERGLSPGDARYAARRALGNATLIKETVREMWTWTVMERFGQDLRYAIRRLRSNRGFLTVAGLSLAFGIGANSAIFSVLNAVMLRSLAVEKPDEVFVVRQQSSLTNAQPFSYPMFERLRDGAPGTDSVAAMSRVAHLVTTPDTTGQSESLNVQLVSGEYFSLLHVGPVIGRVLTANDNKIPGSHPVAVIGHGLWQRRFGGSPGVIGQTLKLSGFQFTIVGVVQRNFRGVWIESPTDVWIPLMMQANVRYSQNFRADDAELEKPWPPQEKIWWLDVIARVPSGSQRSLLAALNATFQQSIQQEAEAVGDSQERRAFLDQHLIFEAFGPGFSTLRQQFSGPLMVLMAMVGLVLLIACANTANLLLARAASREREIAVRLSIGASRARLIQQLLTENLLLVVVATSLGLLLAHWASDLLVRAVLGTRTGPTPIPLGVDVRVLGFTIVVSVITVFLFGLAPAFRATGLRPTDALKSAARNVHRGSRLNAAKMLVSAQVALSLLLLVGAGLFARSLYNLAHVELGFDREHVLTVAIDPRSAGYEQHRLQSLYQRLVERIESLPEVRSAAVAMCGLVSGCRSRVDGIAISGYQARKGEQIVVQENRVSPKYFSTVGMRLVEGRNFDHRDSRNAPRVAVVNEAMVRRYFANRRALGQRFGYDKPDIEIVGIVRDGRVNSVRDSAEPMAYHPLEQSNLYVGSLEVRTATRPEQVAAAVRRAVAEVDSNLPILRITVLTQQVDSSLNQERLVATLTSIFAMLALGLACFGLYGVMSYSVAQRTSELGVRMALGSQPSAVLWAVIKESLSLVMLGLVVGLPIVIAVRRSLASMLFGVAPNDLNTLGTAVFMLIVVAAISSLIPAWRASRVDPLVALRQE